MANTNSDAIRVVLAVSETIREAGKVPSGTLYAALVGKVTYEAYQGIIRALNNAGLVSEVAHELKWIGPEIKG